MNKNVYTSDADPEWDTCVCSSVYCVDCFVNRVVSCKCVLISVTDSLCVECCAGVNWSGAVSTCTHPIYGRITHIAYTEVMEVGLHYQDCWHRNSFYKELWKIGQILSTPSENWFTRESGAGRGVFGIKISGRALHPPSQFCWLCHVHPTIMWSRTPHSAVNVVPGASIL